MNEAEIRETIQRLAPFYHDIALPYGLRTHVPELARRKDVERERFQRFIDHAWPALLNCYGGTLAGRRVLDVACNCGGFSIQAARSGAEAVLGIDVVDHYLEQANFIRNVLALPQVQFRKLAIEDLDQEAVGSFDVSFCFGLLYHLENPVLALKRLAAVTDDILVVDTRVTRFPLRRKAAWTMEILPPHTPDSPCAATSQWRTTAVCQFTPNEQAVIDLLRFIGFRQVERLKTDNPFKPYYWRDTMTFIAHR